MAITTLSPTIRTLGLEDGQIDLGWTFIQALMALGLADEVKLPENTQSRDGLQRVPEAGGLA
jgi:fatty-acid desaturase